MAVNRAHARLVLVDVAAWALMWTYLRRSLYSDVLDALAMPGLGSAYGALALMAVAAALVVVALRRRLSPVLDAPAAVGVAALAGSACLGVATWAPPASAALTCALMAVVACTFCLAFFAMARSACRHAFALGIEVEVVSQIAAATLSFLMTIGLGSEGPAAATENVLGLAASGGLFCLGRHLERGVVPQPAPDAPHGSARPLAPWLALLGLSFFATGTLGYAHYFDGSYGGLETWETPVDVLTLAVLGVMAGFSVYASRTPAGRRGASLAMVLAVTLTALAAFFVVTLALAMPGEMLYGLARLMRRISRVVAFVTVLVMVYQHDLEPTAPFGLAFLVPSLAPKPLQLALSSPAALLPQPNSDYVTAALVTTGFFLTACLVAFCLLNIDGRLARALVERRDDEAAGEQDAPAADPREAACDELAQAFGLTRREADVLRLFARGTSAQGTAGALCISVNTVNTHAMTLYRKLGVHSKQELAELVDARARG